MRSSAFPDASQIGDADRPALMEAMNDIIAVNWKATEPHWDRGVLAIRQQIQPHLYSMTGRNWLRFRSTAYSTSQAASPSTERHRGASSPSGTAGLYGTLHIENPQALPRATQENAGILYGWRTRNRSYGRRTPRSAKKSPLRCSVTPRMPLCRRRAWRCVPRFTPEGARTADMSMPRAYGHIKHHRQTYHGTASLVDAAMSRIIPDFGRRAFQSASQGMTPMPDNRVLASPFRPRDRAYLAWATVATAYAIAFLQRMSPQSGQIWFHARSAPTPPASRCCQAFLGLPLMQIPAGLLVDRFGVKRVVLPAWPRLPLAALHLPLAPTCSTCLVARLIWPARRPGLFTALLKLVAQKFRR